MRYDREVRFSRSAISIAPCTREMRSSFEYWPPDPGGMGLELYRRIKIPEDVVERPAAGLEGAYEAEYLVEPEHIKEGAEIA